jgi:hypothetical protein
MIKLFGALAAIGIGLVVLVGCIEAWVVCDAYFEIYGWPLLEGAPKWMDYPLLGINLLVSLLIPLLTIVVPVYTGWKFWRWYARRCLGNVMIK